MKVDTILIIFIYVVLLCFIIATRSKSKSLAANGYNNPCHVKIHRIGRLYKLAMLLPTKKILTRRQSAPNLASNSTQNIRMAQSPHQQPVIDMAKIRSILKNPVGKPRTIIGRRNTVHSHVRFDVVEDDDNNGNESMNTTDATNEENETQNESATTSQDLVDEYDPF